MSSKKRLRSGSSYQRPYGSGPASPTPRHRSNSPVGPLVFGIAFLLAAGAFVYAVTRPKPARTATPAALAKPVQGPRIEYARYYDFGRAPADSFVDCLFTVTNTGTAMLEIPDVRPGCGCMKTNEWTRHIPPGRTGTIPIRLDTHHYTGNFAKSIFVTCNDPGQTNFMLEIRGFVERALEIMPPTAVIGLSSETTSNQAGIKLISHASTPFFITDLKCTLPNIALEVETNQPGKEYQLIARTIPPLPTAFQQGQISFATSLTNIPTTNLNVLINYQAVVQLVPFQLRLPAAPLASPAEVTAWVRNNGTNQLVVTEAVVNAPGATVSQKDDPANRGIAVTAGFPAGFQAPAGTNLELIIRTTHPAHPELRAPIFHMPQPPVGAPK